MKMYRAICDELYNRPHLIMREKLEAIAELIEARRRGEDVVIGEADEEEDDGPQAYLVAADGERFAVDDAKARSQSKGGLTAVVPLFGTLLQHAGLMTQYSGGTSTTEFGAVLAELDADEDIGAIVIEVHSPGGQVWGTAEVAEKLYRIREAGKTRIVAVANSLAASAAVWIATAAGEFVSTPGGDIGSIGVLSYHTDYSKMEEKAGIKTTLIATPPEKIEGHPYEPLPDDVRARIEKETEKLYGTFRAAVAKHRGVTVETVDEKFGGGRMLMADEADAAGLVDRVATFDDVLSEISGSQRPRKSRRGNRNRLLMAEAESA